MESLSQFHDERYDGIGHNHSIEILRELLN